MIRTAIQLTMLSGLSRCKFPPVEAKLASGSSSNFLCGRESEMLLT
jgi:hypothetical protein